MSSAIVRNCDLASILRLSYRWLMNASAPQSGEVASPCTAVCQIDPVSKLCQGCKRTLGEIAAWSGLSEQAKRAVWQDLPNRD